MPDGGKITIETANFHIDDAYAGHHFEVRSGQYVMITVSDTGTGMSERTIARAFEPFSTTKETGKGTGLGLSQVHGFVEQSGGHIKIYSELGQGTTVKMYFARTSKQDIESAMPRGAETEVMLVVEGDARVREITVSMVCALGYTVLQASSAAGGSPSLTRSRTNSV